MKAKKLTLNQFRESLADADRMRLDRALLDDRITSAELRRVIAAETGGAYTPARSTISLHRADLALRGSYATDTGQGRR